MTYTMVGANLKWNPTSNGEMHQPVVSSDTLDPHFNEDSCDHSEQNASVVVLPRDFTPAPWKLVTNKAAVFPSPNLCKPKALENHDNKTLYPGCIGSCNSFGSASVSTYSTSQSTNATSVDSGSRRLSSLSSFELSTGSTGSGSVKKSRPIVVQSVFERLASSKTVSTALKFKSIEKHGEKDVAVNGTLNQVQYNKTVRSQTPARPRFNNHTQKTVDLPELKKKSRPVYPGSSLPLSSAFKTKSDPFPVVSSLRQKMLEVVRARTPCKNVTPSSTRSRSVQSSRLNRRSHSLSQNVQRERNTPRRNNNEAAPRAVNQSPYRVNSSTDITIRQRSNSTAPAFQTSPARMRSQTPPARMRSQTPSTSMRSQTPSARMRSQTPSGRARFDIPRTQEVDPFYNPWGTIVPPRPSMLGSVTKMTTKDSFPRLVGTPPRETLLYYRLNAQETYSSLRLKSVSPLKNRETSPLRSVRQMSPLKAAEPIPSRITQVSPLRARHMSPIKYREPALFRTRQTSPLRVRPMNPYKAQELCPFKIRQTSPLKTTIDDLNIVTEKQLRM